MLIHGIFGQSFVYWNLLKRYLNSHRYHFHEIRLPFLGFGDLRKSAARIAQDIDKILIECADETYENRVDIIAHSAGGLAARYFMRNLGGDSRVHSLITLGTPHHGTRFSHLAPFNLVARQTLPGSDFLRELNDGPDTREPVHYVSLYSNTDGIVLPPRNARLEGARNIEIPLLTHWGFLWDKTVYKHIRMAIDHEPASYPMYPIPGRAQKASATAKRPGPRASRRKPSST